MLPTSETIAPAVATGAAAIVAAATEPVMPFVGVAASTFLAACTGALIGLAYVPPEKWDPIKQIVMGGAPTERRRYLALAGHGAGLVTTLLAIAVLASWAVVLAPHFPLLGWTAELPKMPAAGFLAAGGQYFFPAAFAAGKRWFDTKWSAPK